MTVFMATAGGAGYNIKIKEMGELGIGEGLESGNEWNLQGTENGGMANFLEFGTGVWQEFACHFLIKILLEIENIWNTDETVFQI